MTPYPDPAELASVAAEAADDKKATDLVVLDVGEILSLVELFLLATANNERQLKAVAEAIEDRLRERYDLRPLRREGQPSSGWMLLDYGDVVCHLFAAEQRAFYDLERLWSDVPRHDPLGANATAHANAQAGAGTGEVGA